MQVSKSTTPTISQVRQWDPGALDTQATEWEQKASTLGTSMDASARAVDSSHQYWIGSGGDSMRDRHDEIHGDAATVRTALENGATAARSGAKSILSAKNWLIAQVSAAESAKFTVSDTGQVSVNQSVVTQLSTGNTAANQLVLAGLEAKAAVYQQTIQAALVDCGTADSSAEQAVNQAFANLTTTQVPADTKKDDGGDSQKDDGDGSNKDKSPTNVDLLDSRKSNLTNLFDNNTVEDTGGKDKTVKATDVSQLITPTAALDSKDNGNGKDTLSQKDNPAAAVAPTGTPLSTIAPVAQNDTQKPKPDKTDETPEPSQILPHIGVDGDLKNIATNAGYISNITSAISATVDLPATIVTAYSTAVNGSVGMVTGVASAVNGVLTAYDNVEKHITPTATPTADTKK